IHRDLFDRIDVFATSVPAFARIAFSVFVRQYGALSFHDRRARKIFAGDQFDILLLALLLEENCFIDLPIDRFQAERGRSERTLEFVHAPLVTATFKTRVQKCLQNSNRLVWWSYFASDAKNICV